VTALGLVVVLWLAVLVPPALKRHHERRQEFLESFQKGLGALGAAAPSAVVFDRDGASPLPVDEPRHRPASAPSPAQRRRTIFALLLVSMAIAAVPAVVFGGKATLAVFLAFTIAFLAYVGLVVRWRDERAAAARPVTPVPAGEPELLWDDEDEPLIVSAPRVRAAL